MVLSFLARDIVGQICRGFDPRNVEHPPAAHVLTRNFVRYEHHVAFGLTELGAVPFVGVRRKPVDFPSHDPLQIIALGSSAKGTLQVGLLVALAIRGRKLAHPYLQVSNERGNL